MLDGYVTEIITSLLAIINAGVIFIIKRIFNRVDGLEKNLTAHRIEDARNFITRQEHDDKLESFKSDMRDMIGSIGESVRNIENYIREKK